METCRDRDLTANKRKTNIQKMTLPKSQAKNTKTTKWRINLLKKQKKPKKYILQCSEVGLIF